MMLVSIEGIHLNGNSAILCGRGTDLCRFEACESLSNLSIIEEMERTKILHVKDFKK